MRRQSPLSNELPTKMVRRMTREKLAAEVDKARPEPQRSPSTADFPFEKGGKSAKNGADQAGKRCFSI